MKTLKLYYIDDEYVNYLRKFDNRVPYNKNRTRPYIGVVYEYNGINYFAPLASPKSKHLKINDKSMDVFKIDNGRLGVVNLNNMLPTPFECLSEVQPTLKDDDKYKGLLIDQLNFINKERQILYAKIVTFQKRYRAGYINDRIKERCCNFELLEEKCSEYNQ